MGCAASAPVDPAEQPPAAPAPFKSEPWSFENHPGHLLTSAHYQVYTTFDDAEIDKSVVQVMEAALKQYQRIAPGVPLTDRPMQCYLFGTRTEWTDFTRRHTGPQANVYLQINRGGYTVRDWYVAYFVGEAATYSVAAHEGWHQFVYRHFKGRLPPFLEEGIATMFEDVNWHNDLPYWKLSVNRARTASLRRAIDNHELFPLPDLMQMHAGNVVRQPAPRIEAFYSEDWAFATYLWAGDNGRHRAAPPLADERHRRRHRRRPHRQPRRRPPALDPPGRPAAAGTLHRRESDPDRNRVRQVHAAGG